MQLKASSQQVRKALHDMTVATSIVYIQSIIKSIHASVFDTTRPVQDSYSRRVALAYAVELCSNLSWHS